MNKSKLSDLKIIRLLIRLLQPDIIAMGAIALFYTIIIWSINRGVSIDEGYYLLGYLQDQPIKYALTDFHSIVKSLFFFLPEDNALYLRIIRFIVTLLALFLFTLNSYHWLTKTYSVKIDRLLYFSLSFLSGIMCFAYASPVLYYDNIQMIIYLFSFALLFRIMGKEMDFATIIKCLILGILIIFAITNYLPAGVLLLLISVLFVILGSQSIKKKVILSIVSIFLGLIIGVIVYSLFINNVLNVGKGIITMYTSITKFESAKYETVDQFFVVLKYITGLLITVIPVIIAIIAYYFSRKFLIKFRFLIDGIFSLVLIVLVYMLSRYYSNIIILPILFVFLEVILGNRGQLKKLYRGRGSLIFLIVLLAPLMAVLGSNQLLSPKMFFFMPFWFLALYILYAEYGIITNGFRYKKYNYVFIITISIVFVFQGFLRHPHYNYSIKRSGYPIENAVRFKGIKVSEYQNAFYENGITALTENGFIPGQNILAFFETYMLVYAAGGYVPNGLTYWAYNFASDPANIPEEKVRFIIIDEQEIEMISEFLSETDWDFPKSYKRTDLGTDGQNLTQLGFNYILFSAIP